mmetsp:Transcript_27751/g.90317  ORF Transcript_27751/g.90317 Transcript_27751/m.90317 type:complete len:257 (-) Transcript_27751:474-1244(-)
MVMSCCSASSWMWSLLLSCSARSRSCSCLILIFCSIESLCLLLRRLSSSLSSSSVFLFAACSLIVLSSSSITEFTDFSSAVTVFSELSVRSACFLIFDGSPLTFIITALSFSTSADSCVIDSWSPDALSASSAFSSFSFCASLLDSSISDVSCEMCCSSPSIRGRNASMASLSRVSFSCAISSFCFCSSAISSVSIASLSSHRTTSASAFANSVLVLSSSSCASRSFPMISSASSLFFRSSSFSSLALGSSVFSFW